MKIVRGTGCRYKGFEQCLDTPVQAVGFPYGDPFYLLLVVGCGRQAWFHGGTNRTKMPGKTGAAFRFPLTGHVELRDIACLGSRSLSMDFSSAVARSESIRLNWVVLSWQIVNELGEALQPCMSEFPVVCFFFCGQVASVHFIWWKEVGASPRSLATSDHSRHVATSHP